MYIAELKGKLSSKVERSEDILTSNIFSFFKYTDRNIFLNSLLKYIGLELSADDLSSAQFIFWPRYDDNTEPDLVIIVGNYYLLFEAKYFSDFGEETENRRSQLIREIEGGLTEAKVLDKEFILVAITADYYFKKEKFDEIKPFPNISFKWINWQLISDILRDYLEGYSTADSNYLISSDLSSLLEKKNLRSFRSFSKLKHKVVETCRDRIFFRVETANFRGGFIGFRNLLSGSNIDKIPNSRIFFSKRYFSSFKPCKFNMTETLFFKGERKS